MANIRLADGSILNQNINVKRRDRLSVRHTITPSASQKIQLANAGLQWVRSSNVSGVGVDGNDLIIRFLNGSLYRYPNQAKLFDNMMKSSSKGHFVWERLRRPKVAYQKIGTLPFDNDPQVSDEDIFNLVDREGLEVAQRLAQLGVAVLPLENPILGLFRP